MLVVMLCFSLATHSMSRSHKSHMMYSSSHTRLIRCLTQWVHHMQGRRRLFEWLAEELLIARLPVPNPPKAWGISVIPPISDGCGHSCDTYNRRYPKSSWNFEWFTKGGPSTHLPRGGIRTMFRSESFPS